METLQNLEQYEELKQSTRSIMQVITSNDLYYGLFLVALLAILLKAVDFVFRPFIRKQSTLAAFLKACIKVFLVIIVGFRLFSLIPGMKDFAASNPQFSFTASIRNVLWP